MPVTMSLPSSLGMVHLKYRIAVMQVNHPVVQADLHWQFFRDAD